jgi:hypothetical protein
VMHRDSVQIARASFQDTAARSSAKSVDSI